MSDHEFSIAGRRVTDQELRFYTYFGFKEDEVALLDALKADDLKSEPGFITEVYGIRTRVKSLWPEMADHDGAVVGVPSPGNWHWEATEWLAVMRSVLSAQGRYRIMELGAGWGPAAVAGSVLARRRGLTDVQATAVEAEPHHYETVRQHFLDNGLDPSEHVLINAAVGVHGGVARWPIAGDNETLYGNRPMDANGDYLGRAIGRTRRVEVRGFRSLLKAETVWDLVHIDVQGGEFDICRSALTRLNRRVARVCLGVHSRKLDGDLFDLFWRAGWVLEGESPTRFIFYPGAKSQEAMTSADGTQVWRNPRLRAELKATA